MLLPHCENMTLNINKVIDTRAQVQGVWCTREQPPSTSQRFICLRQNWLLRRIVSEPPYNSFVFFWPSVQIEVANIDSRQSDMYFMDAFRNW